jgi:hypothetical protein
MPTTRRALLLEALLRDDYYLQTKEEMRRTFRLMKEALRLEAKLGYPIPMNIPIPPRAEGARKFALVISMLMRELSRLDRYERRARSRLRAAIQEFDGGKPNRRRTGTEST